jgi:preprotein translocase subunit SecG
MTTSLRIVFLLVIAALLAPEAAFAYGGPGSVISGIGAFLAAVAALLATLFGFIWFPLKRLYKRLRKEETPDEEAAASTPSEANPPSE